MSETEDKTQEKDKLQSEARIEPVTLESLPGKIRNTSTSLGDCALSLKLEWYANTLERLVRELTEQRERGVRSAKDAWEFYFSTEAGTKLYNSDVSNDDWQQGAMEFAEAYASSRLAEVTALIREAIKAHDALEGSAPNFELALRNRLSGRMFRLAQEIGDENV